MYLCLAILSQVHIGTALTVDVGTLRYHSTADVILGATASAIFVVVVVIATVVCLITVGCKQYKKRLSNAKAQNEQLEQDGDSIGVETNLAYKPMDELPLSQNCNRQGQVPLSLVIVNESVAVSETPMDGTGVEEEEQRAESRLEEGEANVTYYTPMNAGEVEEGGMSAQSRAVLKEAEHESMSMAEGALLQAFQGLG